MKATKEEIIASAKKIIEQVWWKTKIIESTIEVKEEKVSLYALGNEGCYDHDGWRFSVDQLDFPEDSIYIFFLDDGTPTYSQYLVTDASGRTLNIIKDEEGNYKGLINDEDYFKHHNFDFSKKGFEFRKFKTY